MGEGGREGCVAEQLRGRMWSQPAWLRNLTLPQAALAKSFGPLLLCVLKMGITVPTWRSAAFRKEN